MFRYSPQDFYDFLSEKVELKVERGNRVFPVSDKASDITKCLEAHLKDAGVEIHLEERCEKVLTQDGHVVGIKTNKTEIKGDKVILCTGGLAYPSTGSEGDGYRMAKKLGHTIIEPVPALVGIETKEKYVLDVQGLSLKNVRLTIKKGNEEIFSDFGEMLFAHYGISGPIAISASSYINRLELGDVKAVIDLKPALDHDKLEQRLIRDFAAFSKKELHNYIPELLPKSLGELVLKLSGIEEGRKCSEIRKEEREKLISLLKGFELQITGLRPFAEAIVTAGGVSTKEINPKTMESKLCEGLYFAGEIIDVDALTGGFNITVAAITGFTAGNS